MRKTEIEGVPLPVVLIGFVALCIYPLVLAVPSLQNLMILTLLFGAMGSAWISLADMPGKCRSDTAFILELALIRSPFSTPNINSRRG